MAEKFNWSEYRPTKATWLWSCVGCIIATLIIGFTWGGWVTGGTAEKMATDARKDGRAQLAASVCVGKFMQASDAATRLEELKAESSWQRDDFVKDGNWARLVGVEEPIDGAAGLCAEQLANMEVPAANDSAAVEQTSVN